MEITIKLKGDKESVKELLQALKEAASNAENVVAEEAIWDLYDQIENEVDE